MLTTVRNPGMTSRPTSQDAKTGRETLGQSLTEAIQKAVDKIEADAKLMQADTLSKVPKAKAPVSIVGA